MLNVCVIGLGPMGKRHLLAIEQSNDIKLVAVVEQNLETLHLVGAEYKINIKQRYNSYKDASAHESFDIVVIATNGPSHYSIFKEVIYSGVKMVLCEKPIATSLSDARDMEVLSKKNGVKLIVNHARRWTEDYIRLKEKLSQNLIGKIESYMFSMGGGQLGCNATHFIDLICFLSNEKVSSVIGFLNDENIPNPRGQQFKDPGGYALMHLSDETRVFFEMTEDLATPPILIINGTIGRVVVEELKRVYTVEKRSKENEHLPITRYGTPLSEVDIVPFEHLDQIMLIKQAYQFLIDDKEYDFDKYAYHAIETVIAIHYSNELSNRAVKLPILDEHVINQRFSFT
jgi:predicted dehydrogenase